MKILVVSQFFGSDTSAVGQFVADAVAGMAERGHQIRVICGQNDYNATYSVDGEEFSQAGVDPHSERDGRGSPQQVSATDVQFARVGNLKFSHHRTKKLLSYATFYAGSVWRTLLGPRPDLVLTLTAPPGLAWLGWIMQRVCRCRHVVWEMDVYPDIATAVGIAVPGWVGWLLDYPRRHANAVIALGPCMRDRLLRHGIPEERIRVVENWSDGQTTFPRPFPVPTPLRVLYSGNLGLAHDVVTIRGVLERLANDPGFHFEFAGGGPQRQELADFCQERDIANVRFRPYVPFEQLGASLAEGHIGLVTQKAATIGAVVPSKLYGLMAAGRPVLYIGPAAATPALALAEFECGWQVDCGDVEAVIELLRRLAQDPEEIRRKGERGRRAFLEHYDRQAGVARLCESLGLELRARVGEPTAGIRGMHCDRLK